MGKPTPSTAELKRQIIAELELARAGLVIETRRARDDWNPLAMVQRSLRNHPAVWIAGSAVVGFVAMRLLFPPKFRSDKSTGSDRKRGFSAILGSLLFKTARNAAINYFTQHFKDQAESYLYSKLNRHEGPERPPHVAS